MGHGSEEQQSGALATATRAMKFGLSRGNALLIAVAAFASQSIPSSGLRDFFNHSPVWFWLFDTFHFVLLPTALLVWLARVFLITPEKYGLVTVAEHESWLHFAGLVVFVAIILYFIYQVADDFFWVIFHRPETIPFYKNILPNGLLRIPLVLYFAATAGLFEEIFFRGLPLLYFQSRYPSSIPRGKYVLGTSMLFGAIHWGNGAHEVLATFTYGVFASLFYLKLRDLWPLVGAHALTDLWEFW